MAKVKILGVSRKTGTYEGFDYDNIMFHATFTADGMIAGDAVKAYKLKTVRLLDAFEDSKTPQPVKELKDLNHTEDARGN